MDKKNVFRVIINGKIEKYDNHGWETPESIIRSLMHWYSNGTIFVVIDPEYRVSIFQKYLTLNDNVTLIDYLEKLESSDLQDNK